MDRTWEDVERERWEALQRWNYDLECAHCGVALPGYREPGDYDVYLCDECWYLNEAAYGRPFRYRLEC
jgi:hypothetical protein